MKFKSSLCESDQHVMCGRSPIHAMNLACECSCHGDEPPAGVREPHVPSDPPPTLVASR